MNMRIYRDLIGGLVFMALSVAYYIMARGIADAGVSRMGPAFVPEIIAIVTFVLSLILVIQGWRTVIREHAATRASRVTAGGRADADLQLAHERRTARWSVLASAVLLVAYVMAIDSLGFVLSTVAYLFLQSNAGAPLGKRSFKYQLIYLISAVAIAWFVNWSFRDGFLVLLPEGTLG